ncbi:MAG TPA: hypothetical protein VF162_07780 [Streptosporangiaceae bacterium]
MRTGGIVSRWVIGVVIAAALAGAVLAVAGVQTPARVPLALLFLLAAPGLAVAVLFGGIDALGRVVIAGSAALVIDMAIAESMIATGTWSLRLGIVLVALVSVVLAAARPLVARGAARRPAGGASGTAPSAGSRQSRR